MSARLAGSLASHADVVRGSSRVPGAETRDEPLTTSEWEATGSFNHRECNENRNEKKKIMKNL